MTTTTATRPTQPTVSASAAGRLHLGGSVMAAAPVLALVVALPAHYPNGFDTLGHLGLVYLATAIFVVGALIALPARLRQGAGE